MKRLILGLTLAASILASNAHAGILITGVSGVLNSQGRGQGNNFALKVSEYSFVGTGAVLLTGMAIFGTSWAPLLPILLLDKEATEADILRSLEHNLPDLRGHSVIDEVVDYIVLNKNNVAEGEEVFITLSSKDVDKLFLRHGVDADSDNATKLRELLISDKISE